MPAADVYYRNLRTLTAFGAFSDQHATAQFLQRAVGAGVYTTIAINDALADLMRQGFVETSGDGYKRVGTVESYRREHNPSNLSTRNAI